MVSREMKYELDFSPRNQTYIIQFKPSDKWFFRKLGFHNEIQNNGSKDSLMKYAIAYCEKRCSKLIIYNSLGSVQDVRLFNYGTFPED